MERCATGNKLHLMSIALNEKLRVHENIKATEWNKDEIVLAWAMVVMTSHKSIRKHVETCRQCERFYEHDFQRRMTLAREPVAHFV